MKANLLILFTLLFSALNSHAQCSADPNDDICRGLLGGFIFNNLYGENENPYDYIPAYYPSPYIDLQENTSLAGKLKLLYYLQYENGLTAMEFTTNPSYCFKLEADVSRIEATVNILEAWNIPPDYSGSSPFDDIDTDEPIFGYANRAYDEGFIDLNNGDFDPNADMSVQEAVDFVDAVLASNYHPVNEDLHDIFYYLNPGIYTPFNLGERRGVNQGVFSHYGKDSFSIDDIEMSLDFSHLYSTTLVELPTGFYKQKPLGTGWSHTYNAYIVKEEEVGGVSDENYYFIVWPDGTIHTFDIDENEYVSTGVYDELDEFSGGDVIRIRKKDQTDFRFEQLDNNEDIFYLIEIQDPNGNEITIEYETSEVDNDLRRIEYVEAPSGAQRRLNFFYENNTDYLTSIIDPIGRTLEFDVDTDNDERLEEFTDAKGNLTEYKYVENDENAPLADQRKRFLMDEIVLPRGNKVTAEYNTNNAKLEEYQIDNQDPVEIEVNFDFFNGIETSTVTTQVDNNSEFIEDYLFNTNGLVTDYESDTDTRVYIYPNSGEPNITLPISTNFNDVEIDYEYDSRGNVTEINKENGDIVEEFDYDSDNNLVEYVDGRGNSTFFDYDNNENLIQIQDALSNTINFNYDGDGQLISKTNQEGISVNFNYNQYGALTLMQLPENIDFSYGYDGINRLLVEARNGQTTHFSYDNNDNLLTVTNSGGFATTYTYDPNDNTSTITNAEGSVTSFTYDDKDRLIEENFSSLITSYEYNSEGYLETKTKPSGEDIEYDYDNQGRINGVGTIIDFDYNGRNLLSSIANADSRYNFEYDNLNRLDTVEEELFNTTVRYDYDDNNNIRRIYYPDFEIDFEVEYDRDAKNRITSIDVSINGVEKEMVSYTYRDDDLIESVTYSNGVSGNFTYDNAGRKTGVVYVNNNGDILFENSYQLDTQNNVSSEYRRYGSPIGVQQPVAMETISYAYNSNNHIAFAGNNNIDIGVNGNIETEEKEDVGASGATNLYYQFDTDDRLVAVGTDGNANRGYPVEYIYDAYGNRIRYTLPDENFSQNSVWDIINGNEILEFEDNPVLQNRYFVWGPLGLEVSVCPFAGCETFFIGDLRGSVVAKATEDGTILNDDYYRYDDFGNILWGAVGSVYNEKFSYLGKHGVTLDHPDYNHYNMKARIYDAQLGRFISEDPIWSPNLYPYADNNPISKIDPSGEIPVETVLDVASIGISAYDYQQNPSLANAGYLAWDIVATVVPYLPGSYIAKTGKLGLTAAKNLDSPNTLGKIGESKSIVSKNTDLRTPAYSGGANYRIPDGYLEGIGIYEVKNVSNLSYTSQLRDFAQYAKDEGLQFVLYVRGGTNPTKLSKPLQEAVKRGDVTLMHIPN